MCWLLMLICIFAFWVHSACKYQWRAIRNGWHKYIYIAYINNDQQKLHAPINKNIKTFMILYHHSKSTWV